MEISKIFQAVFGHDSSDQSSSKRTLPIHYPLLLAWSLLKKRAGNLWKSILLYIVFFGAVFAVLFYAANLDFSPPAQKANLSAASFAGKLKEADLQKKIGTTDVSSLSYNDWAESFGLSQSNGKYDDDPDGEGLPNFLEYTHLTNPIKPDSDGDGFSDRQEITNGYDPDAPGDAKPKAEVAINKIKVVAPMIWSVSSDEAAMQKDLENGVIHIAKTSAPGQTGNMIISGHSSNYVWAKGNYKHIFQDLNNLAVGDTIDIKTIQQNGRVIVYHYKVAEKKVTAADDPAIFEDSESAALTLSTCWPLGTNLKRLIIRAELI